MKKFIILIELILNEILTKKSLIGYSELTMNIKKDELIKKYEL
jgi:hypothetical protein